jgi:hypothetical protein
VLYMRGEPSAEEELSDERCELLADDEACSRRSRCSNVARASRAGGETRRAEEDEPAGAAIDDDEAEAPTALKLDPRGRPVKAGSRSSPALLLPEGSLL